MTFGSAATLAVIGGLAVGAGVKVASNLGKNRPNDPSHGQE
jgi:hypothetical protein